MSNLEINNNYDLILAVDGSEHAIAAVDLVDSLPLPQDCKISIISVLIPRNAQYYATLTQLLEHISEKLKLRGHKIETQILTGYPAEQIIKFAEEHKAKLIILGAKGLRGTIRILLGGVAQQVVEFAHCPVLIVRSGYTQAKNVLLATDGSEYSLYAINHLKECPLPRDASITIMHVLQPEMTMEMLIRSWPYGIDALHPILSTEIDQSLEERAKEEQHLGEKLLDSTIDRLSQLGFPLKKVLVRGDAATEILSYAEEHMIDLIIGGSRGLSQFQSWLLGSVSNKLTHYAECSVLIVK